MSVNLQINENTKNTVTGRLFYHDLGGSRDLSTIPQPVLHQRFRQLGIRQSRWIKLANVTCRVEQSRQERIYDSQNDNNLTARCERRNRPLNCGIGSEAARRKAPHRLPVPDRKHLHVDLRQSQTLSALVDSTPTEAASCPHLQPAISGMSSPYRQMYSL
jgi:hypothetical protein